MAPPAHRLAVDFGTSHTVAMLQRPDGRTDALLFDGSPSLPSAIFAAASGEIMVGRDAIHHAQSDPGRFEPHPKRRIDEQTLLLGPDEITIERAIGAVLGRVQREAVRVANTGLAEVVLTCPVQWGARRRNVLIAAAREAGLPITGLVLEPTAAAHYLMQFMRVRLRPGATIVIYDFGAGTFDATVMRYADDGGFTVLATEGLADAGGLDVDAAVVAHLGAALTGDASVTWSALEQDESADGRRDRIRLWDQARTGKEALSRHSSTFILLPRVGRDMPLGREQLDRLAGPVLLRTAIATGAALREAGVQPKTLDALLLVGGASRMPLVATLLHRRFGLAPTALEQPELVVAQGALLGPATPLPKPRLATPLPKPRPASQPLKSRPPGPVVWTDPALPKLVLMRPVTYNDARALGEHYRDGAPVALDLTHMDDADAKRLIDFSAGTVFVMRGNFQRITDRVFLLTPANIMYTVEEVKKIIETVRRSSTPARTS